MYIHVWDINYSQSLHGKKAVHVDGPSKFKYIKNTQGKIGKIFSMLS